MEKMFKSRHGNYLNDGLLPVHILYDKEALVTVPI